MVKCNTPVIKTMLALSTMLLITNITYATNVSKSTTNFMYVISADKGHLLQLDNQGHYALRLDLTHVNQVIKFSDRPQRIVDYISGAKLSALWKVGSNSFKSDPPNAVFSSSGFKPAIVVLTHEQINNHSLEFLFTTKQHLHTSDLKDTTLTIDYCGNMCGAGDGIGF